MRTKEAIQERKAERAAREAVFFALALRFVEARIDTLTPGVDTTPKNFKDLQAEKDELTRRVEQATLEAKGRSSHDEPRNRTFCSNVFLSRGGSRRT